MDPLRFFSGLVLVLIIIALVIVLVFFRKEFNQLVTSYMEWVEENALIGYFIFMVLNIILVPLMIPGTLLAILGSYIYGMLYGKILGFFIIYTIVIISNTIGGYFAFLMSRSLFYECLKPTFTRYKYLRAMNRGIAHNGFKIITLCRLCPVVPYNVFNYVSALTDVTHSQFFWGTLFGMIPLKAIEVLIFINLTVDLANIIEGKYELGSTYRILLIVGGVMAVGLIIWIGYITKKELDKELMETRSRQRSLGSDNRIIDSERGEKNEGSLL